MHRQFYYGQRGRQNFNREGGRRFQSNGHVKSFDPTNIINTPQKSENTVEDFKAVNSFADFKISDRLKQNISCKGYTTPTPIQDQVIPIILDGCDLIGVANTGTGKTAAFLIPLIDKATKVVRQKVLIITPTRELAIQIKEEFLGFAKDLRVYCALCIGGANIRWQINDLRRNPGFVIGTPGRIQDLVRSHTLNLSEFNAIVLDETDRMVDIGFLKDIKDIISRLPRDRQSLFFSATVDGKTREILDNFVHNPVTVSVKKREIIDNITQGTIRVPHLNMKVDKLHELLIQKEYEKVLVFGRTKHGVQRLSDELVKRGFKADAIHGNKRQAQRVRTLDRFKRNEIQILIATDVASRGLDIPNVSHVINYDLPESYEAYIHRIGRTGRADKKGTALTFIYG
jgi:ATP-dependent RNA helicase RhlE